MLKSLNITNLAVISNLQVEFDIGLNIISGETGSGKSIILKSLGLLLGDKASVDLLRTGESRAVVEGVFDCEGNIPLLNLCKESGVDLDDGELIIKRELVSNGRGKIFVNNQAATLNLLKAIQPHIIDVHGQGDQQSLLSTEVQTVLLDNFAGTTGLRDRIAEAYEQILSLNNEILESQKTEAERLQLMDLLEYQISEIEAVNPLQDEDAMLESERRLLQNSERLATLCVEINQLLYDDDEAITAKLANAQRRLDDLTAIDTQFSTYCEQLANVKFIIEDISFAVRNYADRITFSPQRLQVVEDRLSLLERLKRKYGGSLAEVILQLDKCRGRKMEIENADVVREELERRLLKVLPEYKALVEELAVKRRSFAKKLESAIKEALSSVALDRAQFKIFFNKTSGTLSVPQFVKPGSSDFIDVPINRNGGELVEFYFTANKGEEPRLLSSVASGGELSRLMLLLKTILTPSLYPRTLVFDEIDTGIGGMVADKVGKRLKQLSKSNQVICITHQAQIARYADCHLKVTKEIKGQRTSAKVFSLDLPEREEEVARMIAGSMVTEITRKHARELISLPDTDA